MKTRKFRSISALTLALACILSMLTSCHRPDQSPISPPPGSETVSQDSAPELEIPVADLKTMFLAAYQLAEESNRAHFPGITIPCRYEARYSLYRYIGKSQKEGTPYATATFLSSAIVTKEDGGVTLTEIDGKEKQTGITARAIAILLYQLDQDPRSYTHMLPASLLEDPVQIETRDVFLLYENSIYVCPDYAKYGYESVSDYLRAYREDRANYKGGIYQIPLSARSLMIFSPFEIDPSNLSSAQENLIPSWLHLN